MKEICNCPTCGKEHDRAEARKTWAVALGADKYCSAYCYTQAKMQTMETKRTPGKWENQKRCDTQYIKSVDTGDVIAIVQPDLYEEGECKANAAFIVEACNNYEAVKAENDDLKRQMAASDEVDRSLIDNLADALEAVLKAEADEVRLERMKEHHYKEWYTAVTTTINAIQKARDALKRVGR